jgi:hypothetical protein
MADETTATQEQAQEQVTEEITGNVDDLLDVQRAEGEGMTAEEGAGADKGDEAAGDGTAPTTTETPAAATPASEAAAQPPRQEPQQQQQQAQRNNARIAELRERIKPLKQKLDDKKFDGFDDAEVATRTLVETLEATLEELNNLQQANEVLQGRERERAEVARATDYWSRQFSLDYPAVSADLGKKTWNEEVRAFAAAGMSGEALNRAATISFQRRMDAIKAKQAQPVRGSTPDPKTPVTKGGAAVTGEGVTGSTSAAKVVSIEDELAKGNNGRYRGMPGF